MSTFFERLGASPGERSRGCLHFRLLALATVARGPSAKRYSTRAIETRCYEERQKVEQQWAEVKEVHQQIDVLLPSDSTTLEIDCSGTSYQIRKGALFSA